MIGKFITDNSGSIIAVNIEDAIETVIEIKMPRFAYWETTLGKSRMVETSDDLAHLQLKHGPGLDVVYLRLGPKLRLRIGQEIGRES